ncbi:MAG: ATP-binding protein [Clostridia bacterium]|nr:ATP-binding protein [Clostridia bacterium]
MKHIGSLLSAKIQQIARSQKDRPEYPEESSKDYNCITCEDRGIIVEGDFAKPCACMRQKALLRRFKNALVSREMLQHSLDKFQLRYYTQDKVDGITGLSFRDLANQALAAARNFVREALDNVHGDGLLYTGPVGCGKTFLASSIANALMEGGREVLFIVVPDLLDEIKATYDQNRTSGDVTEHHLMEMARTVEILILDDLGAHNYTDWARNRLYSIINYRLNHHRRTVVTTNLSPQELEDYIGERTTSRLVQMCQIRRLAVATDIRYRKHDEKQRMRKDKDI